MNKFICRVSYCNYPEGQCLEGCDQIYPLMRMLEPPTEQEPVAWKHDCAALLTNDVELWIDACPHCGKPRPAPQPKPAEQEPVAAQHRFRHPQKGTPDWSVWQPCKVAQRPAWEIDSQGYEVEYRALYTAPQPVKREQEPVEIEMPEYHSHGMGCGLEDRGITDRYEAMEYGWYEAIDRVKEELASFGPLYTGGQP